MRPFLDSLLQDVTYAGRSLRKSPGFALVAVLSLALGIGANTTIFTFVNAVLLRPLPYPNPDRLVVLREQPHGSTSTVAVHPQNFLEWQARVTAFDALALLQTPPLNVMSDRGAEQIARVQTTSELFHVFGLAPELGRGFTEDETRPGRHDIVILGHGYWQRSFGGDPGVIGRRLIVSDGSLTIVGVAPAGLRIGVMEPDAYTPLPIDPLRPASIGSRSFQCYGRLKPGVSLEIARAELAVVSSLLQRKYQFDEGYGASVSGLHEYLVREGRPALQLLMTVVATVLLIACMNLAALLMARGIGRRGELAVRASLGASRGRLIRQLVIESLVLSSMGGAAGLAFAFWATRILVVLTAGALTAGTSEPIRLDSTCLAFTVIVSTMTSLVFGFVPAWQASRIDPQGALRERPHGGAAGRRHRMRRMLVVTEIAMAVVLLVGAGLLLRTFSRLVRVDLGFQPAGTLTMGLFLGVRHPEARIALVDQIIDRVEALPGVKAASTIQFLPLSGMTCGTGFWLEGQTPGDLSRALSTECALISRGYFAAMGIPVAEGRPFDRGDRAGSARVLIVNQSFARRYFPDGRAVGRRIFVSASNQTFAEIVGVVGDIRHNGLTSEAAPTVYLLHAQTPGYITNLVARVTGNPREQATAIRQAIQAVDPSQAVSAPKSMDQYVSDLLARPRLYAVLMASFAQLALMLGAIGVYGLIAQLVSQRTREIGIRLALGAGRRDVFRDFLQDGLQLTLVGVALGIGGALLLTRFVSTFLFGLSPTDPLTYVAAAGVFSTVALLAIALPARRAARLDPIAILRNE